MKYNRTELGKNIGFSAIIDEKFKTGTISIRFITPLSADSAAANSLGMGTLTSSNSVYKTFAALNEKLSALYGAGLSTATQKRGDVQILGVGASWICNKYALDEEDIEGEMLEIVRDCIFAPNVKNGEFDEESFNITRKDLLDHIDAELNNKRGYAISRAAETAFKGEPAENSCYGTKETAQAVTSAQAFEAYEKLLRTAQVEIFYVSPQENPQAAEIFRESFAKIKRESSPIVFRTKSPINSEVVTAQDEFDVRQCKMVLTFKSDSDDTFAIKMMSTIFGETPVSKLFMNVREKMSLCYYCACRPYASKGALMVDIGAERDNLEKAKAEILHQLDEIKQGNITDTELESAVASIENSLCQVGDTPSSYTGWYFERFCSGKIRTPQEQLLDYKNVTKARIVEAANSMKLDSIYLMLNKEEVQ